jgi:hypothetical protein
LSYLLVKKKMISLPLQRKIWNAVLLICFLVTATIGVLMSLGIYPFKDYFVHVEFGIALTTVAVFHILWHLYYFRALFRK